MKTSFWSFRGHVHKGVCSICSCVARTAAAILFAQGQWGALSADFEHVCLVPGPHIVSSGHNKCPLKLIELPHGQHCHIDAGQHSW